eukprot:11943334-Prorocentrum_lima.AAC.1
MRAAACVLLPSSESSSSGVSLSAGCGGCCRIHARSSLSSMKGVWATLRRLCRSLRVMMSRGRSCSGFGG